MTSAAELAAVLRWVRGATGLDFEGCHRDRMAATVERAWVDAGAGSHEDYVALLRTDREVFDALTEALTVGESYFFREPAHFTLLQERIAPERLALHGGPLRIWSAGCAGGEEPHSAAIALDEVGLLDRADILATDISERALQRARDGVYGQWSLRRCDDEERQRWFHPHGPRWRVDDRYRSAVTWRTSGLLDGPPANRLDLALCRNVLIYLAPATLERAAAALHDALAPGGWLLVGASDPPLEHPGLELCVDEHGVTYRRAASTPKVPPPAGEHRPTSRSEPPASTTRARPRPRVGRARPVPATHRPAPSAPETRSLDAEGRLTAAVEHLDAGRYEDAAAEAAAARYLDPGLVGAHLLLAHTCEILGDARGAVRSYRHAHALLAVMPSDASVAPVDEPAGRVLDAVQSQIDSMQAMR